MANSAKKKKNPKNQKKTKNPPDLQEVDECEVDGLGVLSQVTPRRVVR